MAQDNTQFFSGALTTLVAVSSIAGMLWRSLMSRVKEAARKEAEALLERRLADVASKTAVEDVQRAMQHVTERIDELFKVLITNERRSDQR